AHLHDREPGDIIHIHATGVSLGFFFQTIGISLSSSCLSLDDGRQFCNQGVSTLKLFVNDNPNDDFENYFPRDGDRILITYGSENSSVIGSQLDSVKSGL
ncbi:MAG: protein-disulfide isomerase, partial [Candidatus Bathyarchaeia archaeon]